MREFIDKYFNTKKDQITNDMVERMALFLETFKDSDAFYFLETLKKVRTEQRLSNAHVNAFVGSARETDREFLVLSGMQKFFDEIGVIVDKAKQIKSERAKKEETKKDGLNIDEEEIELGPGDEDHDSPSFVE